MNWGKSNQLTLFWYKIFEADLGSCIWVTALVLRILWMLGNGCPSKTLNRRSCDCCLFLAVWYLRAEGSFAAHPGHAQVTLRSQSPDAASQFHSPVPTWKRQKRAGQELGRRIILQESWKMLFFRRTWWDSDHSQPRVLLQLLEQATQSGSWSFSWHCCWTSPGWINQHPSIPAAPLSYKTDGDRAFSTALQNRRDLLSHLSRTKT